MLRPEEFSFPRGIVAYGVWAYHRLAPSAAHIDALLSERGVGVSSETFHPWLKLFGKQFASCIRHDRPRAADKWHLYEVVIALHGVIHWLWRTINSECDVFDIRVQLYLKTKVVRHLFEASDRAVRRSACHRDRQAMQLH